MHCIFRTGTPKQIQDVGAAAEDNVLTVVDDFADAGMKIGRSASADIGLLLEQI
jgi:hypothetical protein